MKFKNIVEKILLEITDFCKGCNSSNCCPEDECVLFRIERIVLGDDQHE